MGVWQAAALASEFGFSVVGSMVAGVAIGRFLDSRLGTSPLFVLLGLIGGLLFSIYLIYAIYRLQLAPRRGRAAMARRRQAGEAGEPPGEPSALDRHGR